MRIKYAVIAALGLLLLGAGFCLAANDVTIYVNGQPAEAKGILIDGKTMVPVRFVSETLGAKVNWDGTLNRVLITTEPKMNLIKLNGEATTWPYWYENGVLYMEYRDAVQIVRECHPHPSYVITYYKDNNAMAIDSKRVELSTIKRDGYTLLSLNQMLREDLVNYEWDEKNANLIIKPFK